MPIKNAILKKFRSTLCLMVLISCVHFTIAQVNDAIPAAEDSGGIIKQLVKDQLAQQLKQCASYQKIEQNRLTALIKDSAAIDSLGKLIMQQAGHLKKTVVSTGKSVAADAVLTSKQLLQDQFVKLMQTQDVKGIIGQFTGIIKQPLLQFKGGSINMQGQMAPSLFNNGNVFINSNIINAGWSVMGIPVGLQVMRQDFTGPEYYTRNTFSFQFDRDAYLNSIRDKIKLKIKATDLLPDYNDALQKMKEAVLNRLASSLDSINDSYKGFLAKQVAQLGNPESLLKQDVNVLQDKLLSAEFLQSIEYKKNLLAQMQQQFNTGGAVNKALYDSLLQSVQSAAGVNEIINKIKSFKDEVQQSGLLEKLQQAEQFKKNTMQQWMQDPAALTSMAKEQLDLNGIQKLFLNMSQFKMGMNAVNLSPLTVYQYINNGINAAFANNKNYLFIMAGRQKEFSNLFDNRFANPVFAVDNSVMGIRIGKGGITENHTHLSLFTYKQNKSLYNNNIIHATPATTVVATFSNQLKLNETNWLDIEISKSAHKYDNQQAMYDTLQQGTSLSKQLLSGENFVQQMAFTLQWNGEIKDKELSYDLHGTRIGKGYNNPGSIFLSRGMTEFGGSLRKSFFDHQLQLSAKGNYREYEYSNNASKWRNYNFSFQGKWKLKKGQYIALRYQPYQSLRWQDDRKYTIGGSNRLSVDGNFRKRFGKINYQHTISLSGLKNNYRFDSIPVNNRSLLVSSLQTITISATSYYLNMQYNMADAPSALLLFNTQFNADAGLMYSICKGVMGSTAINYNSTKAWFQQIGIKQTISGQIGERFTVSVYADIVKNIKEYRPNNMSNTRFDWSLQYLLK